MAEARESIDEAIAIARSIEAGALIPHLIYEKARIEFIEGEFAAALDIVRRSIVAATEMKGQGEWIRATLLEARILHAMGEVSLATLLLRELLPVATEAGQKDDVAQTLELLATLQAEAGDYEQAYETFRQFTTVNDEIKSARARDQLIGHRIRSEVREKDQQIDLLTRQKEIATLESEQARLRADAEHANAERRRQENIALENRIALEQTRRNAIILAAGAFLITSLLLFNRYQLQRKARRLLEKSHRELALAHEQLSLKNEAILGSIRYAERIQQALLPSPERLAKSLGENRYFSLFLPRDIVSGDFFWLHTDRDHTYLAVVDCTGHGVPGAFLSIMGYTFLQQVVAEKHVFDPGEILTLFNRSMRRAFNQESAKSVNYESMDMILIKLPVARSRRDVPVHTPVEIEFAGARRPLFTVEPDGEQPVCKLYRTDRFSIGGRHRKRTPVFSTHRVSLPASSCLYLTTDGFIDSAGPEGAHLGPTRFRKRLSEIAHLPARQQYDELARSLSDWSGDRPQRDDITVIGLKFQ